MIRAWADLSRNRDMGMAIGPIKYTDMVWYAERAGLEDEAVNDFCVIVATMDDEFLKKNAEDNKPKGAGNKSRLKGK